MDENLVNFANALASELQAYIGSARGQRLYQTGNMKAHIRVVVINDECVDVIIATNYASFTNTRGKYAGWVEKVVRRTARCYAENNNVEDFTNGGLEATLMYGG
mgnify:CR=1 FL=1